MHTDTHIDAEAEKRRRVLDAVLDHVVGDEFGYQTEDGRVVVWLDDTPEYEVVLLEYQPNRKPELLTAEQVMDENPWLRTI